MDITALSNMAVTYLIDKIKEKKGAKSASDEISTAIWTWIRPIFLKDESPVEDLKNDPNSALNQQEVLLKINKYLTKNSDEIEKLKAILGTSTETGKEDGNNIDLSNAKLKAKGKITIIGGDNITR